MCCLVWSSHNVKPFICGCCEFVHNSAWYVEVLPAALTYEAPLGILRILGFWLGFVTCTSHCFTAMNYCVSAVVFSRSWYTLGVWSTSCDAAVHHMTPISLNWCVYISVFHSYISLDRVSIFMRVAVLRCLLPV